MRITTYAQLGGLTLTMYNFQSKVIVKVHLDRVPKKKTSGGNGTRTHDLPTLVCFLGHYLPNRDLNV